MENLSHSRKPNRGSSQATFTKRTTSCNGAANFSGQTMYDDVFGGPPRFGACGPTLSPRPEDYTEIFGGFHTSRGGSIPVLDLPLVENNNEVTFDVRNPRINYADIFGGFDGLDFAASYEELMRQADGVDDHDRDGDSSEEAWLQAETESLSEGSDHSGKDQYFSNGDYYEPIDSSMEFNISYHKANLRSNRDKSNGVTHVAQLHADPEYAYVMETPLQKKESTNPPLRVTNDIDLEFIGGVTKKKHLSKTVSCPSYGTAGEQTFTNGSTQREYQRNSSCSNDMFVTISAINLRTLPSDVPPPSRPPPLVDVRSGSYQNDQQAASGGRMGDSSPPFFDVEIDSSSAAAASAAAMKDAMDKAQVKLKSAKELMERKREGMKSSTKLSSKSDGKGKKERSGKAVDGSGCIKDERERSMYRKEDTGTKISVREERQKAVKTQAADSLEGDKLVNMPKRFVVEKHEKESQLVQKFDTIDGADEWQEATQFFELVRTDKPRMDFEQTNNEKYLAQSTESRELQQKAKKTSIGAVEQQVDSDRNVEAVREDLELEKVKRDMKTAKESCERGESTGISKPAKEARRHKGREKKVKAAQEVRELEENGQSITERKTLGNGKKPTGADELGKREKRVIAEQKENRVEVGQAMEQQEDGHQEKETSKSIENLERVKECQEREDEDKSWREVFEQKKNETKLEQVLVQAENEKRLRKALEQEEKEKRLKEAREQEEKEKKEKEARELEESEKIWRMALEQLENEKRLKQACLLQENERRQRKALEQEEMEKKQRKAHEKDESKRRPRLVTEQGKDEGQQKEVIEREQTENRLKEVCKKEAIDKGLKEACEKEETAKRLKEAREKGNFENMLEEAVEQKDYSKAAKQDTEDEVKQKVVEQEETEESRRVNHVYQQTERGENGKKLKISEETHQHAEGEDPVASDEVNKLNHSKKCQEILVGKNDQNCHELEEIEENGKMKAEFRDSEKKSEAMGKGDVDGKFSPSGLAPCDLNVKVNQFRKDDFSVLCHQDDSVKKAGEAGIGIGQRNTERIYSVHEMETDNNNQGLKCASEWRERARIIKEAHIPSHLEENKFVSAEAVKESVETRRKPEKTKASVLEGKGSIQKTVQQVKIGQDMERKDKNMNQSRTPEEKEAERLKRERELEKERLRKKEEEREKEREREKDRMAVDRAAFEARERGYAETCERAEKAAIERATAEACQRAMAEARDRLEKACAEAREKSSMEARLRAERAAVERATAEARERAVEKAMAEMVAFEGRERVERTMSDKFSTSSRNSGIRTSFSSSDLQDQHFQRTCSFGGLGSAYNGVEGESAQRCKARLERYRRTAERVAKALEEKNMRDLIAQRELAERNRLAETLDADVKRWSSGKEGNLRALLSTLQYILGPESGWQPIPLTEVITSAAVKKAYRKATLCVHPDKLQQRRASIQQKYICEKVFDLLKEAWNRFNSEER